MEIIISIISLIIGVFSGFLIQKHFRKEQYRFEMFLERKQAYKDLLRLLDRMNEVANRRIKKPELIKYKNELQNIMYANIPFISPKVFGFLSQYLMKFTLLREAGIFESLEQQKGTYEADTESLLYRLYFDVIDQIIKELAAQILLDTKEFTKIISQKDELYNKLLKNHTKKIKDKKFKK